MMTHNPTLHTDAGLNGLASFKRRRFLTLFNPSLALRG
jgi:hypothetical protein